MANYSVTFDSNSLQTANIITEKIDWQSMPAKTINMAALAHGNRSVIPYVDYPNRSVVISGTIIGTSQTDVDTRVDNFKLAISGSNKNLDIDNGTTVRRYIATVSNVSIDRPGGLTYALFTVTFTCTYPFGYNTATSTLLNTSGNTSGSYTPSLTFGGTAPVQQPVITYTPSILAASATNLIANPGFEVDTTGWSSAATGTAFARITTQHNSGVAALQVTNSASTSGFGIYGGVTTNYTSTVPGQSYNLSAYFKGSVGGETVQLTLLGYTTNLTLTTGWQQISVTFTATATTSTMFFYGMSASSVWYLDDVSLTTNSSATISIGHGTTGQSINITRTFIANQPIVIDCYNRSVTVNSVEVAFTGAFPEFKPGTYTLGVTDTLVARTYALNVTCLAAYL